MKIIYTDGPDYLELPDGLGLIERGKAIEVPDILAVALIQQGGFESAEKPEDAIINIPLEKE
jgi:hypothetical protein